MSAADRDYWKEREPSPLASLPSWPVTYWLMGVLVVCFALQHINNVYGNPALENWLFLTLDGIRSGWVWQLVTFQFLHGSVLHLVLNLFALWCFARNIEQILGWRRFLIAYITAGMVGGVLQSLLMWTFPNQYMGPVLGASAGIEGIFVIFCLLHPEAVLNFMLLIPVRARILLYILAGYEIFFTLVPSNRGDSTAHAAHLGGMMFGALWVRWGWHHEWNMLPGAALVDRIKNVFYRPRRSPPLKVLNGGASRLRGSSTPPESDSEDLPPAEFIAKEVDPILDKIGAHGMASLTERERKILAAARDKVAKR